MSGSALDARDDRRHRPADASKSRDSLFFNLILPEEDLGLQIYTWVDQDGVAGRQVALFGPDRRPVALEVEQEIAMGDADFDDWDAAGLRIGHPQPLHTAQVRFEGQRVALDYDFTGIHEPFAYSQGRAGCPEWMASDRFEQTGRVQGEIRLGERVIAFDQLAHRDHSWGRRHWSVPHHWKWIVAQTPSGRALHVMLWIARGELGVNGYVLRDGEPVGIVDARAHAEYDEDMTQRQLLATLHDEQGGVTELELDRFALLRLPFGSDTVVYEAACRASIDGEAGSGQFETLWPASYLERLTAVES
jgi:hypothetical protein